MDMTLLELEDEIELCKLNIAHGGHPDDFRIILITRIRKYMDDRRKIIRALTEVDFDKCKVECAERGDTVTYLVHMNSGQYAQFKAIAEQGVL
jgi:hypothetical protein